MKRFLRQILPAALCLSALGGCMKWDYGRTEDFSATERGLFIVNEGMFQYGNATLSYYDPETKTVENEVFHRANAFKLGDVAQSMTLHNGVGWIAVNNSHVVFAVDPDTFREVGRITNLTSPRYIHFVSDEKAYVTQIWDNRIFIVNPKRYEITGYIECPDMTAESGSTEQMVQYGKYVFVNCWSYQNRILKIDTETDRVVGQLTVGIQPASLAMDRNNKLWTVTDGGYEGSPYGYEAPSLYRIDAETFSVEKQFRFRKGTPRRRCSSTARATRSTGSTGTSGACPSPGSSFRCARSSNTKETKYYGLTVDPANGDVYVADAVDYQQQGVVYRYTAKGEPVDEFHVGVAPGAFCWK